MIDSKLKTVAAMAVFAVFAAHAAVVRKMPDVTVVEGETLSFDSLKATSVRSSNPAVFSAALRESGEAIVSGTRLGEARFAYVDDERGVFATRNVTVVPPYWDLLNRMFADDPEVVISIAGDKIVVSGATANIDTLKRADSVKSLDQTRIVSQVTYSTAQICDLVKDFLVRAGMTNAISVKVVGREVCLSGRMYDAQSIDQLRKRVEGFVRDFPGISVNTDDLKIIKQKIMISVELVQYNDTMSRNLGFRGPDAINGKLTWKTTYENNKNDGARVENFTNKGDADIGAAIGANAEISATINMLKSNGAAKTAYSTSLSTQSGVEATFQNGGKIYKETTGGALSSGDVKEIEYGYTVKATPFIVDSSTINLDLNLDNKEYLGTENGTKDYKVSRYQTNSKYLLRPGESIILSGFTSKKESEGKNGTPWLSHIPWIGPYLFGNTSTSVDMDEMMLVVTVDWSLEGDSEKDAAQFKELKDRKVEVEMP